MQLQLIKVYVITKLHKQKFEFSIFQNFCYFKMTLFKITKKIFIFVKNLSIKKSLWVHQIFINLMSLCFFYLQKYNWKLSLKCNKSRLNISLISQCFTEIRLIKLSLFTSSTNSLYSPYNLSLFYIPVFSLDI